MKGDTERGLYNKWIVHRMGDQTAKHDRCRCFVLDLTHDKHARAALISYAASCEAEYPVLAADLRKLVSTL